MISKLQQPMKDSPRVMMLATCWPLSHYVLLSQDVLPGLDIQVDSDGQALVCDARMVETLIAEVPVSWWRRFFLRERPSKIYKRTIYVTVRSPGASW